MSIIELTNEMVEQYAKKVLGFAYSKTRNAHQAEDLAQEIMYELVCSLRKRNDIENIDAFVYTISNYTWTNFLRKSKKHWNNLDIDLFHTFQNEQNVEDEVITGILLQRLQAEIAYLTNIHRRIMILFFYENKSGTEIGKELNIPHSTVRWHLTEIKKKLKVGIEMAEQSNYEPKRLWCGHDGNVFDMGMRGLGQNPLVDNIALVCYGKELTIEEISRTLQVAAFYIEPHVKELARMDYLRVKDKNKYSTNFYIRTANFRMSEAKYKLHNIKPYAEKIISIFRKYQDEIKSIGFVGSDLDADFLLWAFIPVALQNLYYQSLGHVLKENKITIDTPVRKDGSQHWVSAGLWDDSHDINRFTAEEVDFSYKSNGNGIKTQNFGNDSAGTGLASLQYDGNATIKIGIHWREFGSSEDLRGIERIASIIRNGVTPNDFDKEMIASFANQGYAKMEDGKPQLLIPFLTADEWQKYNEIWAKIHHDIGQNIFVDFIEGFAAEIQKEIPPFISENERIYLKYQAYPQYSVLYWLADNGLLRYPSDEEAKRLSTIIWCKGQL